MNIATGLASGRSASPELVRNAVAGALEKAGIRQAAKVLLFLSHDFDHDLPEALRAAAKTAACIAIGGCTTSGLFTEETWILDQPSAAALVISDESTAGHPQKLPILSLSGQPRLPFHWQKGIQRVGMLEHNAQVWSNAQPAANQCAEIPLPQFDIHLASSPGLRQLSAFLPVDTATGHRLERLGTQSAINNLQRMLPADLREHPPLHQLYLLRSTESSPLSLLTLEADGSVIVSEPVTTGEKLAWAIRHPLSAELEMHEILTNAANICPRPDFSLMFSCFGRGPLLFGSDDRNLSIFREIFPGTPLLGCYGNGQIVPGRQENLLFQQSVLTLFFKGQHAV